MKKSLLIQQKPYQWFLHNKKQKTLMRGLILCCMMFLTTFGPVYAQEVKLNLNMKNATVEKVVGEIKKQSNFDFIYDANMISKLPRVTLDVKDATIESVLEACLKGTKVWYKIDKNVIMLVPSKEVHPKTDTEKKDPKLEINGKVTDEDGIPLPGATVMEEGTMNGTTTDVNGNFTFSVSGTASSLKVSFIGFESQTIEVGNKTQFNIVLKESTMALSEVVITGYQSISKERSAGSFAVVKGNSIQDRANNRDNILESMEGLVPGLSVNMSADADDNKYLIRGITSINSNRTPLFVIDGVPSSAATVESMLNGSDIESVTVLKDATAASIWGSRSANGVIVITTKKGTKNGKLNISYNGGFTYKGKPDYSYQDQMDSKTFIKNVTELFDPSTFTGSYADAYPWDERNESIKPIFAYEIPLYQYYLGEITLAERDAILNQLASQDRQKQYEKYFMSNAYLTNHTISFSGGNDVHDFYVSLGYKGQQGSAKDHTDNYSIYAKENLNITKWMKLDLILNASSGQSKSHLAPYNYDAVGAISFTSLPYAIFYDASGNPISYTTTLYNQATITGAEEISGINLDWYPVDDYKATTQESKSNNIRVNAGLTINLFKGLKYEGRFQYASLNSNGETYQPQETFAVRLDRVMATTMDGVAHLPKKGGYFRTTDSYNTSYTIRNQLSYDNSFGPDKKHQITALIGSEINQNKTASHGISMRGYDSQTMQVVPYNEYFVSQTGVENPLIVQLEGFDTNKFSRTNYSQAEMVSRFVSFYSNAAYTYNNKYTLNGSLRVDQSNLFGSDPSVQYKPIWSLGTAWNMTKEKFMENVSFVDYLSLRLSYGFSGNSPKPGMGGPFNLIEAVTDANYSEFGLGYFISSPANDKLTWEKTRTVNIGFDFSVLKNKLSGSFNLYSKKTTGLFATTKINSTSGYNSVLANIGELTNKGFELSLNSSNITTNNFSWNTNFTLAYNKNKLVKMYIEPAYGGYASAVTNNYIKGRPAQAISAFEWAGLDPADGAPRAYDSQGNIIRSVNDIDSLGVHYKGTAIAPWTGALTNTFRYKNFELSCLFIYNIGNKMHNDPNTQYTGHIAGNLGNDFDKRWRNPGDENTTNVPSYYFENNPNILESDYIFLYRYADINVLDASYIKLRELSFGYNMPKDICRKMNAERVKISVQATNLWLIAFNKEGIDPESFYLQSGSRADKYPPSFSLNLSIDF